MCGCNLFAHYSPVIANLSQTGKNGTRYMYRRFEISRVQIIVIHLSHPQRLLGGWGRWIGEKRRRVPRTLSFTLSPASKLPTRPSAKEASAEERGDTLTQVHPRERGLELEITRGARYLGFNCHSIFSKLDPRVRFLCCLVQNKLKPQQRLTARNKSLRPISNAWQSTYRTRRLFASNLDFYPQY